jgi:hypothetical protein
MTFDQKLQLAYVNTAKVVAALNPGSAQYAQKVRIALQLAQGGQAVEWFVRTDMLLGQGYDDTTSQAAIESHLITLLQILITLGFGA